MKCGRPKCQIPATHGTEGDKIFCSDHAANLTEAESAKIVRALVRAMEGWGRVEDGIPEDFGAWDAYTAGKRFLGEEPLEKGERLEEERP